MRQIQDAYFRQAKREGYFARSVYKLQELNERFKLFDTGDAVLDLGSAPGSWIQYIRRVVGDRGTVAGIDTQPVKPSIRKLALIRQADIAAARPEDFAPAATAFDAVVSDMAPKTSGIRITDQAASLELCALAWQLARQVLRPGGHFVSKVFESPEVNQWVQELRGHFRESRLCKPKASRNESFETFLVARGYGEEPSPQPAAARTQPRRQKRRKKGRRH